MEEVVENVVLADGMRRVRVISDAVISPLGWALKVPDEAVRLADFVQGEDRSLGLHSLVVTWPARDVLFEVLECGQVYRRTMVVWKLVQGERVSMAIRFAADVFERELGRRPGFAWMRSMPRGVEEWTVVGDVCLLTADWAYPGCLFVGG